MVSPIVNCHTHLELGWSKSILPDESGQPFTDWIERLTACRRELLESGREDRVTREAIEGGIQDLLDVGTTHVGDISQTGRSIEPLLESGLAGVVFLEVLGLQRERGVASFERARETLERYRSQERNGLRIGLSPHAPYSTHPDVFRMVADYCLREEVPLCVHLAESPVEREFLLEGTGPFLDLLARLGVDRPPTPGLGPVAYLESLGVLAARPLLVHMVQVTDEELEVVACYGAKVAHCPRSNQLLRCGRMPLEKMLARGISVALGTDGLGSSPSLDVREEAKTAETLHGDFLDARLIPPLLGNINVLD